jgi:hypothetical protein
MKTLLMGAALLGLLTVPAGADIQYDRKLEQAVINIVAGKIGDLRGGFSFDVQPVSMISGDQMSTGSIPLRNVGLLHGDARRDVLAPATERTVARVVF